MGKKRKDLSGVKYGKVLVVSFAKRSGKHYYWNCICDCGEESIIRSDALMILKSCGCVNNGQQILTKRFLSHGECDSREYQIWENMKARCYNKHNVNYKNYGGRGISVCDRWKNSFGAFLEDMGRRPSDLHSLDRYPDVDGDYEKSNCRWATKSEQCRCKRNNVWIEHNGVKMVITDWAKDLSVSPPALKYRINRYGVNATMNHYINKKVSNGV